MEARPPPLALGNVGSLRSSDTATGRAAGPSRVVLERATAEVSRRRTRAAKRSGVQRSGGTPPQPRQSSSPVEQAHARKSRAQSPTELVVRESVRCKSASLGCPGATRRHCEDPRLSGRAVHLSVGKRLSVSDRRDSEVAGRDLASSASQGRWLRIVPPLRRTPERCADAHQNSGRHVTPERAPEPARWSSS